VVVTTDPPEASLFTTTIITRTSLWKDKGTNTIRFEIGPKIVSKIHSYYSYGIVVFLLVLLRFPPPPAPPDSISSGEVVLREAAEPREHLSLEYSDDIVVGEAEENRNSETLE